MRILVTVGTQVSFERLTSAVDRWAAMHPEHTVFAQIGPGADAPVHMRWVRFFDHEAFRQEAQKADLLVAHAGMGTILVSLELGKPLVIMPRRGDLREHRNDHQLATAARFRQRPGVFVADDDVQLVEILDKFVTADEAQPIGNFASESLISAIRDFIDSA